MLRTTLAMAALALLCLQSPSALADVPARVTLQLKWTHAFQFAGYYAAVEQGYYRDAGLEVEIVEAKAGTDAVDKVLSGAAQYGVSNSSLLLARNAGKPVVVLAVVFQHSPSLFFSRQAGPSQTVHDLIGKRVMIEPQSDELVAYLKTEGIGIDRVIRLPHSHRVEDLIEGKVDAMSAYLTSEPYFLNKAGFPYATYSPRAAGIDFYGDNLFTTESELRLHPERVAAFREASLRGWQYAMNHRAALVDLIAQKYAPGQPREFHAFEAETMMPLVRPDLVELGYMNPGRWRHIADTYAEIGLLPRNFSLDGFLYNPHPVHDLRWLYGALALLALISTVAIYIYGINRKLAFALAASTRAERAVRRSEERHRLLAENATDVIWTMNLDARLTYVSPSVQKLRGYTAAEAIQQTMEQALTPASFAIASTALERFNEAMRTQSSAPDFRGELEQTCKDGSTVWTDVTTTSMFNPSGEFIGLLGIARDISDRKRAEERIQYLAQHDALTNLPNRALFSDRLGQALEIARRNHGLLALMFLDLDRFKPVNDQYGHGVGDLLLQEVARRIETCLRKADTVARIGGDEFVVLLHKIEEAPNASAVAEKIREALEKPFFIEQREITVSASIGIAIYPRHGANELELSKRADQAMYMAKRNGSNQVSLA